MSTPDSAAAVSAFVFRFATAPAYSMRTDLSPVSTVWPAKEPSCSASFRKGRQFRSFLGRDGGKVERVGNGAVEKEIRDLLGNLDGDILLRFARRCTEMRRADHIARREQDVVGGWLHFIDVDRGAGDLACLKRLEKRLLVDQAASRTIDDAHAVAHRANGVAIDDLARLVGERRMQA